MQGPRIRVTAFAGSGTVNRTPLQRRGIRTSSINRTRKKSRHGYTSRSPFRVNDSYCATVQHSERADRHTVESPIQPFPGEDHIQKYPTIRLNIAGKQKGNIQVVSGVVSTSEYLFGLGWQVRSGNGLLKVVG